MGCESGGEDHLVFFLFGLFGLWVDWWLDWSGWMSCCGGAVEPPGQRASEPHPDRWPKQPFQSRLPHAEGALL